MVPLGTRVPWYWKVTNVVHLVLNLMCMQWWSMVQYTTIDTRMPLVHGGGLGVPYSDTFAKT